MDLFIVAAGLGALIILFVLFSKRRYRYWKNKGAPQLNPQLIFGDYKSVYTRSKSIQEFHLDIYRDAKAKGWKHFGLYNSIFAEWMVLDLNLIKRIMLKDFEYFHAHGFYHSDTEPLTNHLFNADGDEWKRLRARLTPTFTTGKMKMMFDIVLAKAEVLQKVLRNCEQSTQEVHIKETLARFGTDVIGSAAFGIQCNSLEEPDNRFRQIGRKAFEPSLVKFFLELIPFHIPAKFGYKNIAPEVSSYFTEVIQDTINYREKNNVQGKDFMSLLLQMKGQGDKGLSITDQEIITEAYVFYLAGFETSSTTTTFTLLELAKHQDVQDKLRQEIRDSLKKNDGKITYETVMEMKYLDKVINEALRLHPPVSTIPRECTKRYKVPDSDVVIEKGTRVFIPAWGIQLDPEYYPNPEKFNPENFSPENKAKRPDFAFLPFGEGPRMCIGLRFGLMQTKISLISILKDFKLSPHKTTKWPLVMDSGSLVLSVKGDVWLKIEKAQ